MGRAKGEAWANGPGECTFFVYREHQMYEVEKAIFLANPPSTLPDVPEDAPEVSEV